MGEILQTFGEYPAFVVEDGWRIAVGVRVRAYLDDVKEWKRRLAASHPDAPGGSAASFRAVKSAEERWRTRADQWFVDRGLEPPQHGQRGRQRADEAGPEPTLANGTEETIVSLLRVNRCPMALPDLCAAMGWTLTARSRGRIMTAINRARGHGANIATIAKHGRLAGYLLLSHREYRAPLSGGPSAKIIDALRDGSWHTAIALAAQLQMNVPEITRLMKRVIVRGRHCVEVCGSGRDASYRLIHKQDTES